MTLYSIEYELKTIVVLRWIRCAISLLLVTTFFSSHSNSRENNGTIGTAGSSDGNACQTVCLNASETYTNNGVIQGWRGIINLRGDANTIFINSEGASITFTGTGGWMPGGTIGETSTSTINNRLENSGTISGHSRAVHSQSSASNTVINYSTGIITATSAAASVSFIGNRGTSVLENSGTITGGSIGFESNSRVDRGDGITTLSVSVTNNSSGIITGTNITGVDMGGSTSANTSTLINAGTITGGTNGVKFSATGTIHNTGTINGGSVDILNNSGVITALTNDQGGSDALTFDGALPTTYYAKFNSTTDYGKIIFSNKSGATTFSVESNSTLSTGTYSEVVRSLVSSDFATTTGTFSAYRWNLIESSSGVWDLVVTNRTGYTSRINNAKSNKIAEILEAIYTAGNKSSVTTALDGLSDANLEKALKEIQGKGLVTSKSLSTRNQSNFKRAVSSATNISASTTTQLTKGNFADLSLNDLSYHGLNNDKSFSGYSGSNFSDFLTSNLNKTLTSSGSSENSFFIRTFGSVTDYTAKDTDDTGYQATNYGILAGSQYKITNDIYQGWSLGGSLSDSNYDSSAGGSKAKTVHASIFQKYDYEDHGLDFSLSGYVSNSDTTRKITTGVQQTLLSDATDKGLDFTAGYTKKYKLENNWNFHPSISLTTSYVFQDDTKETGGTLALNVQNDNLFSIKPEIGFSLGKEFDNTEEVTKNFNISLFASREEHLDGTVSSATLNGTNTPYQIELPKIKTDYITAGVGYNFENKKDNSNVNINLFQTQSSDNDLNSTLLSVSYNKTF